MSHTINFTTERVHLSIEQQKELGHTDGSIGFETVLTGLRTAIEEQDKYLGLLDETCPPPSNVERYHIRQTLRTLREKEEMLGGIAGDILVRETMSYISYNKPPFSVRPSKFNNKRPRFSD